MEGGADLGLDGRGGGEKWGLLRDGGGSTDRPSHGLARGWGEEREDSRVTFQLVP